jgi:hypothetical protein
MGARRKGTSKRSEPREVSEAAAELARRIGEEVDRRLGPSATYEQRRDASLTIMEEALWKNGDDELKAMVTRVPEVVVGGKRYRRLKGRSRGTYMGRWGRHVIEEPLYREVGVHNGPTIKPVELVAGIIENMTPDLARVAGAAMARVGSRAVVDVMRVFGMNPPSRAFMSKRVTRLGSVVAARAPQLERAAARAEKIPASVASVSCGLDRMSVRMEEVIQGKSIPPRTRTEPYERTPPPPSEYHYRKAWVGSVTTLDSAGNDLGTVRFATEASADPSLLARRVAREVASVVKAHPEITVGCVQDAAPELDALPAALAAELPATTKRYDLVDFEHLMGYLDAVVDACEPEGDPHSMKDWYRSEFTRDDKAIDRAFRSLRDRAKRTDAASPDARKALADALSYIRTRKNRMRYATHHHANLAIGSGATESTCWQMQQRVKLPGQSWRKTGLSGILAIRALVLSNRWDTAWPTFAGAYRVCVTLSP